MPSGTNLFLNGASWYAAGYTSSNIDEFAFYNAALSQAQIQAAVNGTPANRVFNVLPGVNATLSGLTISNGQAQQGGAIYNQGTLNLIDDVVSDSHAVGVSNGFITPPAQGGAVYNAAGAVLNVNETTFERDSATGGSAQGGAIYNAAGATVNTVDLDLLERRLQRRRGTRDTDRTARSWSTTSATPRPTRSSLGSRVQHRLRLDDQHDRPPRAAEGLAAGIDRSFRLVLVQRLLVHHRREFDGRTGPSSVTLCCGLGLV